MNTTYIGIKYGKGLVINTEISFCRNQSLALSLSAEMMRLGYAPTQELFQSLCRLTESQFVNLHNNIIPTLSKMAGDHVKHAPFYPNFPQQVMEMSYLELFLNAITHYWTFGEWRPNYEQLPREYSFEKVEFKEIKLLSEQDFDKIIVRILSSKDSISSEDKDVIKWFLDNRKFHVNVEVPFKETLCYLAGLLIERNINIVGLPKTATDVLRIATHLSGGDISLADNTKFKSLPRATRRTLVKALEAVIREEDLVRHKGKFIRLFHSLHVGDFSQKVYNIAKKIRQNEKIKTFNGAVEEHIRKRDIEKAVLLLEQRPGDFARRIKHVLGLVPSKPGKLSPLNQEIINHFGNVTDKIPTRNLCQLMGSLNNSERRTIFPKGSTQKAKIIPSAKPINNVTLDYLKLVIESRLVRRFSQLDSLGKVYVDERLYRCALPTQQRSASTGMRQVARGTHLPIGDKNTIRLFVYWKGRDIDLSCTFHDESLRMVNQISYTHLKSQVYGACHSGDITQAPNGASEFIDVPIIVQNAALNSGARYIVMNVFVYNGPTFKEHKECFVGWMTRDNPQANAIYDPKTVEHKVDLNGDSRNAIPVIFDLKTREAIWLDLYTKSRGHWGGNNVHSNKATIKDVIAAIMNLENKVSLGKLFELHAAARATEIVDSPEEADSVFSLTEGVTPYDINVINSEFVI